MTDYETLKLERYGPVGWLIFNRPEQLNAMNNQMRDELADAWKELDADPEVHAQFFDPHVSIGQVVAIEAIGLMRKVPAEAVMRMALVGRHERMSAQRAYELGMISEVVDPPDRLREAAQELGEKIARNSPAAMAATKRALLGALEHGLTDACRAGAAELVSMWGHPDQEEGPRAFAEKREARWTV
jgi:enoyl-CoA hydratase